MSMLVHIAAQWNWKPPYSNKSSWTMSLLRFWLGSWCVNGYDCDVQGCAGQNWENGPTFTPKEYAEIYRMYLDSIIWLAAWGHAQTGCWGPASMGCEMQSSMNCWGSYQNQTLVQPFPTIPYHCTAGKPISGWMPLPPLQGYVGFTGSHLDCILLHFKALLSYLPHLWTNAKPCQPKTSYSLLERRDWSMASASMPWTTPMALRSLPWSGRGAPSGMSGVIYQVLPPPS